MLRSVSHQPGHLLFQTVSLRSSVNKGKKGRGYQEPRLSNVVCRYLLMLPPPRSSPNCVRLTEERRVPRDLLKPQ
jgi:hypothetical protein